MGAMAKHMTFAGLQMTRQEWDELDDYSRLELLHALYETSSARTRNHAYEEYSLHIDVALSA